MLREDAPDLAVYRLAVATRTLIRRRTERVSGCLYEANGRKIELSQRIPGATVDLEQIEIPPTPVRLGTSLYLGHFMGTHYGHFLLKSLSRVWARPEVGRVDTLVMHPFIFGAKFVPFNLEIFRALGIKPKKILIIKRRVAFEEIYVPESLFHLDGWAHVRMREVFARIKRALVRSSTGPERLYLSRTRLQGRRQGEKEGRVEAHFAEHGFTIIHPQELSVADQVTLYANCKMMAGFTGSALHNAVFCQPGTVVIDIRKRSSKRALVTQKLCNELAGAEYRPLFYADPWGVPDMRSITAEFRKVI